MNEDVFSINNFNIIEDGDNYYLFRALNLDDQREIGEGINSNNGEIQKVITNKQRYPENDRYANEKEISLKEIWDHTKSVNFYRGTNCISLSSNANVSIDYGSKYGEKYLMIKVPKEQNSQIYNAGQYMISELNRILENRISQIPKDSEIVRLVHEIESKENYNDIKKVIVERVKCTSLSGRYTTTNNIRTRESMFKRFNKRQAFSEEQQLEYNKIIGKLTLLEIYGLLPKEIFNTINISSLTSTIGSEFSNREFVHYGEISADKFVPISKINLDMFALLQVAKEQGIEQQAINKIENKLIEYTNQRYELIERDNKLYYSNGREEIDLHLSNDSVLINENNLKDNTNFSVEEIFDKTNGSISYSKAQNATQFVYNLSIAQRKSIELANVLKQIINDSELDATIDEISQKSVAINDKIITRKNGRGIQISESVNIDMNRGGRKQFSDEEQRKIYEKVKSLSKEDLETIISNNGAELEQNIYIENLNHSDIDTKQTREERLNRYFAETIIDGLDFSKIYKTAITQKSMTEEERDKLINQIEKADCKRLYNAFVNAGVEQENISGYITNLLMDNGYKQYNFVELSRTEDLENIIKKNVTNLNCRILPTRLDKQLGIEDNSYIVPETKIKLRDYQASALDKVNEIHQQKRYAATVLPTGAGKSFVAMSLMMQYKNGNILYFAPNTEILNQLKRHIAKNILEDENANIEEAFPHLKMFCYQGLTRRDEELLESYDADLIIFDELHRTGATKWDGKIRNLIKGNPNAKILGITATPVRDVDKRNMAREIAEATGEYTIEELKQKRYLASEIYLLDAMQDGIVVSPRVVTFDYSLQDSEQYQEIRKMYEEETNPQKKEEIKKIYDEMKDIIQKSQLEGMSKIFEENINNKNGRYIVFLPRNNTDMSSEEYVKAEIEKIRENLKNIDSEPQIDYLISDRERKSENLTAISNFESSQSEHLKLIFAIDMLNEGVHVDGIDGIIMLRPISAEHKILYLQQIGRCIYSLDPQKPIEESQTPIIFDVYNNYLEQNMDREANRTTPTSDLQRLQLIVNWVNLHGYIPDIESEDIEEFKKARTLKIIKTKYEKYLEGINNHNLSETEIFEIEQVLELGKTIDLWNLEIPEIPIKEGAKNITRNNVFKVVGEQKRFLDLFKKANEIKKERKPGAKLRIRNIISILDVLSEYGIDINNDSIKPESTLGEIFETLTPEIKKLILEEVDFPMDYPIGQEYQYAKTVFYNGRSEFLQYDINVLRKCGIFEKFKKGKGFICAVKDGFIINGPSEYGNINIETGTYWNEEGIDADGRDIYNFKPGQEINDFGFRRDGININTGTIYDKHNFRVDGTYLDTGKRYNPKGFKQDLTYKETRKNYFKDQDGNMYDIDGYNIQTGYNKEGYNSYGYNINGYNKNGIDRYNFDKDGIFYEQQEDGTFINTGRKVDNNGFNKNGKFCKLQKDGTYIETESEINYYGFSRYGRWYPNNAYYYSDYYEGRIVDNNFFDMDGYYWRPAQEGESGTFINRREYVNSHQKINDRGFDRDGYWYIKKKDGTIEKTDRKFDNNGFEIDGLCTRKTVSGKQIRIKQNQYGFDLEGNYYPIRGGRYSDKPYGKYDNFGFDVNGINIKTGSRLDENNFDRNGIYYKRQEDGKLKSTGLRVNERGFNRLGHYCKLQSNGKYIDTQEIVDPEGYTINGYDLHGFSKRGFYHDQDGQIYDPHGFKQDGTYLETGLTYNKRKFNIDGRHIITKKKRDLRGFDIDGNNTERLYGKEITTKYDSEFFDEDGKHIETGEFFYNGYNAYHVDENGKLRNGQEHEYITFARNYIQGMLSTEKNNQYLKSAQEYLRSFKDKNADEEKYRITYILYAAGEMYPQIKQDLMNEIEKTMKEIQEKQEQLDKLYENVKGKKGKIQKLEKEKAMLEQGLQNIRDLTEFR